MPVGSDLYQVSLFVLLGSVVGSFSSVLLYRLPRRESILLPRSHCSHCNHPLGARQLVPLVSFLLQGAKCRWCRTPLSWRYFLLELGAGALVGAAGYQGGWLAGAAACGLWVAGATALGLSGRQQRDSRASESGFSLVEVLVSLLILSLTVGPALEAIAVARQAGLAGQRRSLVLGLAQTRINQLAAMAMTDITTVDTEYAAQSSTTGEGLTGESSLAPYVVEIVEVVPVTGAESFGRHVKVRVSCPTCAGRFGRPVKPVIIQSTIRRG